MLILDLKGMPNNAVVVFNWGCDCEWRTSLELVRLRICSQNSLFTSILTYFLTELTLQQTLVVSSGLQRYKRNASKALQRLNSNILSRFFY